jgi:hypothetical protein
MFITRPTNVAGMIGDKITLLCEVDANPRPAYTWYKVKSAVDQILVGNAANLTLEVTHESAGEYECVASTKGGHYAAVKSQARVYVKSKPSISTFNRIQKSPLDGLGRVTCVATSVPTVDSVEWLADGQTIVTSDGSGRYSVQENRSRDGVKSTLVIRRTVPNDFRDYSCKVTNSLGTDVATFTLVEQGRATAAGKFKSRTHFYP